MDKNIEVLEEVLDELEKEKKKLYDLVDENDFRVEQINSYLRELSKREEDNYKVFSPRSAENTHREQIETDISKKEKYEAENEEHQKKIEFLKNLMDKLIAVIENLQMEKEKAEQQKADIKDEKSNIIKEYCDTDNMEQGHIAHQILNCVSYIVSDSERAKVELTAIAEKMKKKYE